MTIEIGKIINNKQEKDAIHVAVAPVIAYHDLMPGEHIGFIKDDNRTVGSMAGKKLGIVDPYLTEAVNKGQQFWMFLYPNTITSLRHDWIHPEFNEQASRVKESQEWIENWAAQYGMSYDYAMECGNKRDFFLGEVYYDQISPEFWSHFEIITGQIISTEVRNETYFHCAC